LGYNYRLSDINCALGTAQLKRIFQLLSKRERVAGIYNALLKDVSGLRLLHQSVETTRSWFVYVVLLDEQFSRLDRDTILQGLKERGIGCSNYFPPIHLQPFYKTTFGYKKGDFPLTESVSERTIALPFYGNMEDADIHYVVDMLKLEFERVRRL
jgi:perosamine synthetase